MKNYDHKKIEKRWQVEWDKKKTFQANDKSKKPKFYSLIEFPYPSGEGLHVGHPRPYTGMDIVSRKRRMEGYNVLFPIGWDAFGLPTENYAIKTGKQPKVIVKKNTDNFRRQIKSLGISFDWSREINTTDPAYYKWTQWIFLQFLKKGLAYKTKSEINWCPKDKIGLANEEVIDGKCERCGTPVEKREKEQWMLAITKYAERLDKDLDLVDYPERVKLSQRNWIGKSEGSEIEFLVKQNGARVNKKVLIGTRNPAKILMVKACFAGVSGIDLVSLKDVPEVDDSDLKEGDDCLENAKRKSEYYFKKTGIPTISTDHIFWIKKWPKDNGIINHIREIANPKTGKATDEETTAFLLKFLKSVGGKSKAHFIYAISYTDQMGTFATKEIPKEYILQTEQAKYFWPGYPMEALLKDVETGVFKSEQKNEVRYKKIIEILKRDFVPKILSEDKIKVFTTRADTLFGVTYVVLAPEHQLVSQFVGQVENKKEVEEYIKKVKNKSDLERAENKIKSGVELKGIKVINPANNEEIPVWIADYVLPHYGTGAVMAVPAHDERDFEFAKKYNLQIKQVIVPCADDSINPPRKGFDEVKRNTMIVFLKNKQTGKYALLNWHGSLSGIVTGIMGGIEENQTPEDAVIAEIKEETSLTGIKIIKKLSWITAARYCASHKNQNRCAISHVFLAEIENTNNQGVISEEEKKLATLMWVNEKEVLNKLTPDHQKFIWSQLFNETALTKDGFLVNSKKFNDITSDEAIKKITEFVGGKMVTKFKLRDWVFSRQRYWGEPIPVINCPKCGMVPVPEKDLPVKLPEVKSYKPTDNGESPLADISKWVNVKCPKCGGKAKRETDTMPNWAGSSWYYLRYADPKNKKIFADSKKLKYWTPVDWYHGGMEHVTLHLLYSRFWHKFLYDLKLVPTLEPYMKRTSHGLILGEGGVKMSKSLGNVINPDEIVKLYGADTLRVYEMFMGPFEDAAVWNTESIIGSRRFVEKVWRIGEKVSGGTFRLQNSYLAKLLHKTIKKVSEDIEAMRFNTAISAMMILATEMEKAEEVDKNDFKKFLQILTPFAPHVAEERWSSLGEKKLISISEWPLWDDDLIKDEEIKIMIQVNGKVRGEIMINVSENEEEIQKKALSNEAVARFVVGLKVKKIIYVKNRLINIVVG